MDLGLVRIARGGVPVADVPEADDQLLGLHLPDNVVEHLHLVQCHDLLHHLQETERLV